MRASWVRVLVLWGLTGWPVAELPAADGCYSLLHVTPCGGDDVSQVLQTADASDLFCVTLVNFSDFGEGSPQDLSEFDAVIFGMMDSGLDPVRVSELKDYVAEGGGIVWTHDTLDCGASGGPDVENPAGVAETGAGWVWVTPTQVQIVRDHDILHAPFEIGRVGETFTVLETHTTGGEVTTAEIILQLVGQPAAPNNFFLTTHEYEDGRVAFLEIGHSGYGCGTPAASQKEAEIAANTLFWAASGSAADCNQNGVPDSCDIASGVLADADGDKVPDSCQGAPVSFLRADANSDGKVDISDAISTIAYLFSGGGAPACLETADINDDGTVNITDPIFLLAYLFAGGLRPADPFGACGADPTQDSLTCASFLRCA